MPCACDVTCFKYFTTALARFELPPYNISELKGDLDKSIPYMHINYFGGLKIGDFITKSSTAKLYSSPIFLLYAIYM